MKNGWLSGAGISVKVFFESLKKNNFVFLSEIEGDYDDNLYILVTTKSQAKSLNLNPHKKPGPIEKQYGESFKHNEYKIPDEIKFLHKTSSKQFLKDYFWDIKKGIEQSFYIHDNCFFSNYSPNRSSYKSFIISILQVHSYYQNQEIDWEDKIITRIMKLLKQHETIELRSSKRNVTSISYKILNENSFTKIFRQKNKISTEVRINNGKASLEEIV